MSAPLPPRGRGTASNPLNRFAPTHSEAFDDGWEQEVPPIQLTEVHGEIVRTVISRNQLSGLPFNRSISPYRGCEHSRIYYYARLSHVYQDLSPGIDFETRLVAKSNAASALEQELSKPGYCCVPINLGTNTDPYQPLKRKCRLTRRVLEALLRFRHPLTIVIEDSLILRDLDLPRELAGQNLVAVMISLTALDDELKRILEPRVAAPSARLWTIHALGGNGIPAGVLCSPMIPMINDMELECLLQAARDAGVRGAAYMLLRPSREVGPLFEEWPVTHCP